MGEGFLLKDVLSLVSANISSLCRRAKGCALLTCILPWTERTRLFAVLSVYCSTCCYLGQDYNRMSCFRMWLVFSWVRRTIFFLVPNLTSGIIVNYCVLFSRALTSGGSWRQDIGYSPYSLLSVSTECPHTAWLVYCLSLLWILTAVFRDEEISPAIRQSKTLLAI